MGGLPGAAHAAPAETTCSGTLGSITVDGNLTVPAGNSCTLDGTTVTGDVAVQEDADLFATGARLGGQDGTVTVGSNAYVDLQRARIGGDVTLRDSYGLYAETSSLNSGVDSRRSQFIYLYDSSVDGAVQAQRFTAFTAEFTDFDETLEGSDVSYFDVFDSSIDGQLSVADARQGAFLCTTQVEGNAHYDDNGQIVQLGGSGSVGSGCGGNVIEGTLRATDNSGDMFVANNLIEGDLVCRYNPGEVYGHDNTVFSDRLGQCAELEAAPEGMAPQSQDVEDRREAARDRAQSMAEQRRD